MAPQTICQAQTTYLNRGPRRTDTEEHEALQAARAREADKAFAAEFQRRAGIEGTLSRGVRAMHLRRARYVGLAETHLQHALAAAINFARLAAWLADEPRAQTRRSSFVRPLAQLA